MPQAEYTFRSDPTGDPASTDAYADVPITTLEAGTLATIFQAAGDGPIALNWKNTGANSINSKVLGSNDRDATAADWADVAAEAAIAAGASRHVEIPIAYYRFYRFQQQAAVGGSQGATQLVGIQKSRLP